MQFVVCYGVAQWNPSDEVEESANGKKFRIAIAKIRERAEALETSF